MNNDLKRYIVRHVEKLIVWKIKLLSSVDMEPVMVVENNEIIMVSLLAHAHRMPEYLQICFFESEEIQYGCF